MSKFLIMTIFINFVYSFSWANCNSKCEGKEEQIDLCFIEKSVLSTRILKVANYANCGYWSDRYVVNSESEVRKVLNTLAQGCKRVKNLVLMGHGRPGYHSIGISGDSNIFKGFSCLMADDSYVRVLGCNIALGCIGDMFMHNLAKDLFSERKGRINAPTFYATTILPGIIPHFSLNGRSRELEYDPLRRPPESWNLTGLAISDGGTMTENCRDEITDLIKDIKSARKKAERKCKSSIFKRLGKEKLSYYQSFANGLPDNLSVDYYKFKRVIERLEYQLMRLKECKSASAPSRRPADSYEAEIVQ